MARCLEIDLISEAVFSILGAVQPWEDIVGSALKVVHVAELSGPRDWRSIYLVQPPSGPERHYIVTEE